MPSKAIITVKIIHRIIFVKEGLSITCCAVSVLLAIQVNFEASAFAKNTGLKKSNFSERVAT
jgi:hypothetical protein